MMTKKELAQELAGVRMQTESLLKRVTYLEMQVIEMSLDNIHPRPKNYNKLINILEENKPKNPPKTTTGQQDT